MGCDIHCYIEYKTDYGWSDFGGRINPGRNYLIFGTMAGVGLEDVSFIKPRGFPTKAAYAANSDFWLYITEDGEGEDCCSVAKAELWMKYGSYLKKPSEPLLNNYISGPDWHSHSWLNADEFELSIANYLKRCGFAIGSLKLEGPQSATVATGKELTLDQENNLRSIREYWAILAAMRCFEAQGHETRLLFWFDN